QSGDEEITEVVSAVEHKAKEGSWVVGVARLDKDGKVTSEGEWEVSRQALVKTTGRGNKRNTPLQYLTLPPRAGDEWVLSGHPEVDMKCVALEPRRVKVPAG